MSIAVRPASIEDRAVPGHWEGDLLAGAKNTHIATLVERQSRFVQLIKVPAKDAETVTRALTRHVQRLPEGLMASLTWDRGLEMAQHKRFSIATDVAVYFCDPQSPWQRGTNENTNGLLRQYFPKGTDLSTHPGQAERDCAPLEYPATEDIRIHDTGGETRPNRCTHRLNPQLGQVAPTHQIGVR